MLKYWKTKIINSSKQTSVINEYLDLKKVGAKSSLKAIEALEEFYRFVKENPDKIVIKDKCPFCCYYESCEKCIWNKYFKKYPEEFKKGSFSMVCLAWIFKKGSYDFFNYTEHKFFVDKSLERLEKMKKLLDKSE